MSQVVEATLNYCLIYIVILLFYCRRQSYMKVEPPASVFRERSKRYIGTIGQKLSPVHGGHGALTRQVLFFDAFTRDPIIGGDMPHMARRPIADAAVPKHVGQASRGDWGHGAAW